MQYELIIKPSAEKALDRLPKSARQRLVAAMRDLREEPRPVGAVKLQGEERVYRVRVGNYRIVYDVHDDKLVVFVLCVAHRKDVYRGM